MKYWALLIVLFFGLSVSFTGLSEDRRYLLEDVEELQPQPTVNFTWGKDSESPSRSYKRSNQTYSRQESIRTTLESISEDMRREEKSLRYQSPKLQDSKLKKKNPNKKGFLAWLWEQDKKFQEKYW